MTETVVVAVIVSIAPTLAVGVSWFVQRRAQRAATANTDAKVAEVHVIVNGQKSEMERHIKALQAEIRGLKSHAKPKRKRP